MNFISYLVFFLLGVSVGSFVNVLGMRYRPGHRFLDSRIIGGRSRCLNCRRSLRWYELIPLVSFFIQRGRCRSCGAKLSFQYPAVELLSGLIFVAVPWQLQNLQLATYNLQQSFVISNLSLVITLIWVLIFLLLLLLSVIDWREMVIPDQVNLSLTVLGLALFLLIFLSGKFSDISSPFLGFYAMLLDIRDNIFLNYALAVLVGSAFFGSIIFFTKGRAMGWGDFKLGGALGLIFGWPDILLIIALAFITGALYSSFLLARGEKGIKDAVPFGPFLALGATLVFFFGQVILDLYFRTFQL